MKPFYEMTNNEPIDLTKAMVADEALEGASDMMTGDHGVFATVASVDGQARLHIDIAAEGHDGVSVILLAFVPSGPFTTDKRPGIPLTDEMAQSIVDGLAELGFVSKPDPGE